MKATLTPVTRRASAALALCVLASCAAELDTKRGQDGEECLTDQDCRADLICQNRACQPLSDGGNNGDDANNGRNNGQNNGANNGDNNNGDPGDTLAGLCGQVCGTIYACFPDEIGDSLEDCAQECVSDLQERPEDEALATLRCLLELGCDEILNGEGERCVAGEVPEDRKAACEEVAYGPFASCSEPNTTHPDLIYEACLQRAATDSDREFSTLFDCYQFSSCPALVSCVEEWARAAPPEPGPTPQPPYLYLLIEDQSEPGGRWSGADIDAIALLKPSGEVFYASTLEDFQLFDASTNDPGKALGPPDSACTLQGEGFVSLGGQGAYLLVSFLLNRADAWIEEGDQLQIFEVGEGYCGVEQDDPVSLYVGRDLNELAYIGDARGGELVSVPRLP